MPVLKPYTFVAGTPARAAEVNADFDTIYAEVNSLESQISDFDNQLTELENTKADINGSYLNRFSVANPVTNYDAVNKQYLFNAVTNSLPYIYGLGITRAGDNTITVGSGQCYDSTYVQLLSLSSNTSKQNTTQSASTTYYVYIIGMAQGAGIDILITTLSDEPTLPTDYVYYRRIGSYTTDSSNSINSITNTQIQQSTSGNDFVSQNETAIQQATSPTYTGRVDYSVGGTHIAPSNGLVVFNLMYDSSAWAYAYINNIEVANGRTNVQGDDNVVFPIRSGQTFRLTRGNWLRFFPYP